MAEGRQLLANKYSKDHQHSQRTLDNQETSPGPVITDTGHRLQRGPSTPWLTRCCGCACPYPCAQLHMAIVTWPLQSSCTQAYIHAQSFLPRPCNLLRYLGHGAHGHTHTHAHALTCKHDIRTLPYICTCPYKLYHGLHGSSD